MNEFAQTLEIAETPTTTTAPAFGWSPADEQFFHVVDGAFTPTFLAGAGTLLASYDQD
ncbi:MAG: hypothetical protein QOE84_2624 [Actinomycetota bacterium]|jgi:hypothetical protein|nr:hypothetical protein [Actinomycetota bacterium]